MTLATHAIVGAAAASFFPQAPAVAFAVAFGSHFLIDAIPHWDYPIRSPSVNPKIGAAMKYDKALLADALTIGFDALLGVIIALFVFSPLNIPWIVFLGACAGILPDPLQFLYTKFQHEPLVSLQKFHRWTHSSYRMREQPISGLFIQVLLMFVVTITTLKTLG